MGTRGRGLLAIAALCLASCASDALRETAYPEPAFEGEAHVLAQVCLPDSRVELRTVDVDMRRLPAGNRGEGSNSASVWSAQEVAAADKTVRMAYPPGPESSFLPPDFGTWTVDRPNGVYSASSAPFRMADRTVRGQPVLEYFAHRPAAMIAFRMSIGRDESRIDYWFTLPKSPLTTEFTAWQPPVSQEDAAIRDKDPWGTWYRLVSGGTLTIHAVTSASAPKMRFRLQTNREHYAKDKRFVPAAFAVFEQFREERRPAGAATDPLPILAPMSDVEVPGC